MALTIKQRYINKVSKHLPWLPQKAVLPTSAIAAFVPAFIAFAFTYGAVFSVQPENGSLSGGTATVADSGASGGQSVKFTSPGVCQSAANTIGGADPWGGCWPGAYNTGYPHGLAGDTRTPVTLTPYTGSCTINTDNLVIDSKSIDNCGGVGLFIYSKNVQIKNSLVNTAIYENDNAASVTVMDTEINGGNQYTYPSLGGGNNVTAIRVNAHNGEHTIHCYANCDIQDTWLHDQFEAGAGPHQNGFLSNGGSVFNLRHNSIGCNASGCTAAITFIPDDNVSKATIDKNLVLASPQAGYCMDVVSNVSKPGIVNEMTVTNNIFQRGPSGKCGFYDANGGWDFPTTTPGTNGYNNVWSGNKYADGTVIDP